MFWNFDYGWAGSIYNWTLFQSTKVGKKVRKRKFLPYKLVGDAAYPMQP
jgi:hypothetical protein